MEEGGEKKVKLKEVVEKEQEEAREGGIGGRTKRLKSRRRRRRRSRRKRRKRKRRGKEADEEKSITVQFHQHLVFLNNDSQGIMTSFSNLLYLFFMLLL